MCIALRGAWSGLIVLACASAFGQATGQVPDRNTRAMGPLVFAAHKATTPPTLDGNIDPEEWAGASRASQFLDSKHQVEKGLSTFYFEYDEKYIYFAAVVTHSHPPKATVRGTNVPFGIDDRFTFQIDTFGEGQYQGFNYCSVNGLGATNFRKAGGSSQKREWLGEFEAVTRVNPDGWQVEVRVPWDILRVPKSGVRNLRVNVARTDSKEESSYWYYVPLETENTNGVSWTGVDVPPVHTHNLWKFLPSTSAISQDGKTQILHSLDMRGFLNDKYEFSGVLFPDFSLVSRAATTLGFSHFEILQPETRPLFQEGSGYFSGASSIFTTQRIRQFDLGTRFYGSPNPATRIGVNSTIAFDGESTLGASLAANQGPNRGFSVGLASLRSRELQSNDAFAADYHNSVGGWSFEGAAAITSDQETRLGSSFGLSTIYFHGGFSSSLSASQVDANFMPRLGYAPETAIQSMSAGAVYGFSAPTKWLEEVDLSASHSHAWTTGGRLAHESTSLYAGGSIRRALDTSVQVFSGSFDGIRESGLTFNFSAPNSNAPWSINFSESIDRFGDLYTDLKSLSVDYSDPHSRWGISGGITRYAADEVLKQRQLSFAYKLGPYDDLSMTLLNDQGVTNFAIQYARHNNKGIEYWFSFGDPSALKFTPTVIARVAFPIK